MVPHASHWTRKAPSPPTARKAVGQSGLGRRTRSSGTVLRDVREDVETERECESKTILSVCEMRDRRRERAVPIGLGAFGTVTSDLYGLRVKRRRAAAAPPRSAQQPPHASRRTWVRSSPRRGRGIKAAIARRQQRPRQQRQPPAPSVAPALGALESS